MKTHNIVVSGRVQGVGYRVSCFEKAKELGIAGTVRNTHTDDVEIVAQGKRIDEFVAWCRRGPPLSRVDSVDINLTEEPRFKDFGII